MKKWETPDMLMLDVNETAQGGKIYNKVDGNTWDENHEIHSFTFCRSGNQDDFDPVSEEMYQDMLSRMN